ncbi:hypothetical protein GH733_009897 [Mirounga leonina]|nr:hypothetical protein GH733_009897 [Mirounga leonina]
MSTRKTLVFVVNKAELMNHHLDVTACPNQTLPTPKLLCVQPTFSRYLAFNGKSLDVKQTFNPEGEFQHLAAQSGVRENEKLE